MRLDILKTLKGIRSLPTLPAVMTDLLSTLGSEDSSARDVTEIIARDQAVTARVLRLANSAIFGLPRKVGSVQRAIVLLGFDSVRRLALATTTFDKMAGWNPRSAQRKKLFWRHAIAVAWACQWLGRHMPQNNGHQAVNENEAYTAGLLHDIGKPILDMYFTEDYERIVAHSVSHNIALDKAEHEAMGTSHGKIGEHLAKRWSLPDFVCVGLGRHHNVQSHPQSAPMISKVVALADCAAYGMGLGCGVGFQPARDLASESSSMLGLPDALISEFQRECDEARENICSLADDLGGG